MTRFRVRTVDLGLPVDATTGYGTHLVGLPSRRAFCFTYMEPPAAIRFVAFDLDAGRGDVLRGVGGELRKSIFDAKRGVLHALTSHGLYEIALSPLAVRRKLKARIPKHPHGLWASSDLALLSICRTGPDPSQLVSSKTYEVVATMRIGAVDAVFPFGKKPTAFSFFNGAARSLDGTKTTRVPPLGAPLVAGDAVFGISASKSPEPEERASAAGAGWGYVVKLDAKTLEARASCRAPDVVDLLGFDAAGRVVATTETAVVLFDAETLRVVATKDPKRTLSARLYSCDLAGPSTIVALTAERFSRDVLLVEWDADAGRPVVATKPAPPKPAGTTAVVNGKETRTKQTYRDVKLTHGKGPLGAVDFVRCTLDHCMIDGIGGRIVVRHATLERCTLRMVYARNVVFDDCVLAHPKATHRQSLIGCAFKHVVLRGSVGWIHIEPWTDDSYVAKSFIVKLAEANAAFYRGVDWALDLREVEEGDLRIHGVPLELVRRDPSRQLLVRREDAAHPVWTRIDAYFWQTQVDSLRRSDDPGLFLFVPPESNKRRVAYLKAARALREAGVLDEKTGVD
jgi:hypothetical protein